MMIAGAARGARAMRPARLAAIAGTGLPRRLAAGRCREIQDRQQPAGRGQSRGGRRGAFSVGRQGRGLDPQQVVTAGGQRELRRQLDVRRSDAAGARRRRCARAAARSRPRTSQHRAVDFARQHGAESTPFAEAARTAPRRDGGRGLRRRRDDAAIVKWNLRNASRIVRRLTDGTPRPATGCGAGAHAEPTQYAERHAGNTANPLDTGITMPLLSPSPCAARGHRRRGTSLRCSSSLPPGAQARQSLPAGGAVATPSRAAASGAWRRPTTSSTASSALRRGTWEGTVKADLRASLERQHRPTPSRCRSLYDPYEGRRYEKLLEVFWRNVDPTVTGPPVLRRRHAVPHGDLRAHRRAARGRREVKAQLATTKPFKDPIVTPVVAATRVLAGGGLSPGLLHRIRPRYSYPRYRTGCGRDRASSHCGERDH